MLQQRWILDNKMMCLSCAERYLAEHHSRWDGIGDLLRSTIGECEVQDCSEKACDVHYYLPVVAFHGMWHFQLPEWTRVVDLGYSGLEYDFLTSAENLVGFVKVIREAGQPAFVSLDREVLRRHGYIQ